MKEYRSRGVGFVIADQSPARLFDDVVSQPSIKVIFREDYPNNLLFSEDPLERQILTVLENRLALVINGATGEKYLIKTLDYFF
ncbi:MAG: ATP-binding protein [Candidatus Lokiarchaeota archaeon]|nr:ATP-binding protein [Candidatus Lokiarchaeota archaeon]